MLFLFIASSFHNNTLEASKAQLIENYGKIPLSFTINNGQYDPQVNFTTWGNRDVFFLF